MSTVEAELQGFFVQNTANLVEVAQRWYLLTNYMQEIFEGGGLEALQHSGLEGKIAYPNPELLPEKLSIPARRLIRRVNTETEVLTRRGKPIEAVELATKILEEANSLTENNQRGVRVAAFRQRGYAQAYLVDYGMFKIYSPGHILRSLCILSAATDYMRSDLESGYYTDLIRQTTVCFGDAQMGGVQQVLAAKLADNMRSLLGGVSTPVILTTREGEFMNPSSHPKDPSLIDLEQRLLSVLPTLAPKPESPVETFIRTTLEEN